MPIGPGRAIPRWFWTTALGTLAMHNTSGNFAAGDGTRHSSPASARPATGLLRISRRWLLSPGEGRVQSRRCVSVSQGSPQRAEPVSPTGKMEPYSINVFYHPHLRRRPPWLPSTHRDLTLLACFFICLDIEACSESKKFARHLADQLGAMVASMSSVIQSKMLPSHHLRLRIQPSKSMTSTWSWRCIHSSYAPVILRGVLVVVAFPPRCNSAYVCT